MPVKKAFPGMFNEIEIHWSKPEIYENIIKEGSCYDNDAHFYMIIGKYDDYDPKLFYIGKTFNYISDRLNQNDHKNRYNVLKEKYPRHKKYVSLGTVKFYSGRRTKRLIDLIESLLIFSHFEFEDHNHMLNIKKVYSFNPNKNQYTIINKGYRKPLSKEVHYGVFLKK